MMLATLLVGALLTGFDPAFIRVDGNRVTLLTADTATGDCFLAAAGYGREGEGAAVDPDWTRRLLEMLSEGQAIPARQYWPDPSVVSELHVIGPSGGVEPGVEWRLQVRLRGRVAEASGMQPRLLRAFAAGACPATRWTEAQWGHFFAWGANRTEREIVAGYLVESWTVNGLLLGEASPAEIELARRRCVTRNDCLGLVHLVLLPGAGPE